MPATFTLVFYTYCVPSPGQAETWAPTLLSLNSAFLKIHVAGASFKNEAFNEI